MKINLPKVEIKNKSKNFAEFVISPLFPGYGATLGNSLRRVLLSSLGGAAVVEVKIEGATHEFTTIPGVKEDMIEFILALKQIRLRLFEDEATLKLEKKGEGEVKASDIKTTSAAEIIGKDLHLLTLAKDGKISCTLKAKKGIGYLPAEEQEREEKLGVIALDATFTPIRKVNFKTEFTRVGKKTNYDKLNLEIETDGTVDPEDALKQASEILVSHFELVAKLEQGDGGKVETEVKEKKQIAPGADKTKKETKKEVDSTKMKIEEADFSSRTAKALLDGGVKTVAGLKRLSEEKLKEIKGLGEKGLKEIERKLKKYEA